MPPTYHPPVRGARARRGAVVGVPSSRARRAVPAAARRAWSLLALWSLLPGIAPVRLGAQPGTAVAASSAALSPDERVAAGDRETLARRPAAALAHYEAALAADPRHVGALWRASRDLVDLGEVERDARARRARYERAVEYARRAVAIAPGDPETHFHLARSLGVYTLDRSPRERVKTAGDVRAHALRALELAPRHPGALHVMGVWNAEVMRLPGVARAFSRAFLGGKVFDTASWAEAVRYMEASVAVEPDRLVHRLDLARVYRDAGRTADARAAFEAALRCPLQDANDDLHRATAERELRALK